MRGDDGSGLNTGHFTGSVHAVLSYNYYKGDTDNAYAEVAVAIGSTKGFNNFPAYRARVFTNYLEIIREQAHNTATTLATYDLPETLSDRGFELSLQARHDGPSGVNLIATLSQNGKIAAEITASDASGFRAGYAGFMGGDGRNTGTFRGIDITGFTVKGIRNVPPPPLAPKPG